MQTKMLLSLLFTLTVIWPSEAAEGVVLSEASAGSLKAALQRSDTGASINQFVDGLVQKVSQNILQQQLNSVGIENLNLSIPTPVGNLSLQLTQGTLQNIQNFNRYDDVQVNVNQDAVVLDIPLQFNNLTYYYRYNLDNVLGDVNGTLQNLTGTWALNMKVNSNILVLHDFNITDAGLVNAIFNGNAVTDWILQDNVYLILPPVQKILVDKVDQVVNDYIKGVQNGTNPSNF